MRSRVCFLLVLFLLMHTSLFAQYEQDLLVLKYSNNSGEKGKTTFIYHGEGEPYKAVWELEDGSRWSENFHEFDDEGNLIRKLRKFSDSLIVEQVFKYNDAGQMLHETFKASDGRSGEVDYLYSDGILKELDCKGLNGWFFGRIIYSNSDKADEFLHENSSEKMAIILKDGIEAGRILYSYEGMRLMKERWFFDSGFEQEMVYEYRKDCVLYRSSNVFVSSLCGRKISKENYDFSGKGGGPSYYKYEEGAKLIEKEFIRKDGLRTVTQYYYHADGRLQQSIRNYVDGRTGTFFYTYNSSGMLTERILNVSDGTVSKEEYSYDSDGLLCSGKYINFDSWLTGRLSFEHDRYDRIVSAHFDAADGNDAELSFRYDNLWELVEVHWEFESGHSQSYWFEWEE